MVFIVAALAIAFLIGANTNTVPDEIKAKKFTVVDDEGKVLVVIRGGDHGGGVGIYNKAGKTRGILAVKKEGARLVLFSKDEKDDATISSGSDGGKILLWDKNQKGNMFLTQGENGLAITVNNKTGEEVVQISVDEDGNGVVGAFNRKGVGRTLTPGP